MILVLRQFKTHIFFLLAKTHMIAVTVFSVKHYELKLKMKNCYKWHLFSLGTKFVPALFAE